MRCNLATFPTYDSKRNFDANPSSPVMQGKEHTLDADNNLTNMISGIIENTKNASDAIQYQKALTNYEISSADIQSRASADQNPDNAPKYLDELKKASLSNLDGIGNSGLRAKASGEFDRDSTIASLKIGANFAHKQLAMNVYNLGEYLNIKQESRISTPPGNERDLIDSEIGNKISNNISNGTISPEQGKKLLISSKLSGAMAGVFKNPDGVISELKDSSGYYSDLPAKDRMLLYSRAQSFKEKMAKEITDLQKQKIYENESSIAMDIAKTGTIPEPQKLANMVTAGSISPDFASTALKAGTSPASVAADTKDEEFAKLTESIYKSGTRDQQQAAIKNILQGGGDGKLSKDDMLILMQTAQMHGAGHRKDIENTVTTLGNWADNSKINRADVFRVFQQQIAQGKELPDASDIAMKEAIKKNIPGAANLRDVPTAVVSKDSPLYYIFPGSTKVYPQKIFNPKTGALESNTEVAPK
jgi:hypothetical protein